LKLSKNLKIAIIAVAVVVAIIVISLAAAGLVALDVTGSFAGGSEKLTPGGTATGKALVVYDPGVMGTAKDAANKIAGDLQSRGYQVVLAGVSSADASNVSGYDVIVAGGPIYAGKVGSSVYSYLEDLKAPDNAKVGAFASGKYPDNDKVEQAFPDAAAMDAVLLLFPDEGGVDEKCAGFVEELLQ
jgi:flavodoxin